MANTPLLLLIAVLPALTLCAYVDVGIINGTEAKPHSRPYMVSVQLNNQHDCGGFLVSESFVMTAAHCNKGVNMTVVVGVHDLFAEDQFTVRMRVKSWLLYRGFNDTTYEDDIMLLELDQKVKLIRNRVELIPLPTRNEDVAAGSRCTVAGWGRLSTNGPVSSHLMEANVQIIEREQCKHWWGEKSHYTVTISPHMLCTYGRAGFCQGDSGSPLMCEGKVVGVVSFNQNGNCDNPIVPNVYTKISSYLHWVKSIIG